MKLIELSKYQIELLKIIIPAISALISTVAIFVTVRIFSRTVRSNFKPVLIFSSRGEETMRWGWKLQNYGNGPALNVLVADGYNLKNFHSIVNCYPLSKDASVDLLWAKKTGVLVATYSNIYGEQFTSICQHNQTRIIKKNIYPEWKSNNQEWIEVGLAKNRKYINEHDLREYDFKNETDLEGYTNLKIDAMRNQPYARRGYIFKRKDLADYFSKQRWYKPLTNNLQEIEPELTDKEKGISRFLHYYQVRRRNKGKII